MPSQFNGGRRMFSTSRARTTGYPYGEKMNFAPYSHAKGKH